MFAFTTISAAAFDESTASTPVLIAENKYACSKPLKYTDSDGATKEDQVFFIFEKLTYKNLEFWKDYTRQQKEGAALKDSENPGLRLSEKISEGLDPLIFSLRLCPTNFLAATYQYLFGGQKSYDIWMSYSTRKDPRTSAINNSDIEIVMSGFARHDCPFNTHIGISRNYLFCLPDSLPHKEMAMQQHASAMVTVEQIYGRGVHSHMITRPTPLMAALMAKKLNKQMPSELNATVGQSIFEKIEKIGKFDPNKSVWINCDMAYAQRKYYTHLPAHTHNNFPLDNRDSKTWKLVVSEDDIRTFPRPLWFPHDGYTGPMSGEHQTLGNTYFSARGVSNSASSDSTHFAAELVAVSAPALSDIWYRPVE